MSLVKNFLLVASLLASLTLAVPMVAKRDIYTHYETEYVIVTIEETATVWVNPPDPTSAPLSTSTTTLAPVATTTALASTTAAAFHEVPAPAPAPSTLATSIAPTTSIAVVSSTTAQATAALPTESEVVNIQPKDTTGSSTANCEGTANTCAGDVTHWDGGLGACGWNVDTESQFAIALPHAFMGTQSNGNPYCGRAVTLVNPVSGTTVQATVGDKCMGCEARSIDCTNALFNAITDGKGDGRLTGIQWYFS